MVLTLSVVGSSIHYFFQNESKVNSFLTNVSDNLKPGGKFVGTAMDAMLFDELSTESALIGTQNDDIVEDYQEI